jgi:hypothetical protein
MNTLLQVLPRSDSGMHFRRGDHWVRTPPEDGDRTESMTVVTATAVVDRTRATFRWVVDPDVVEELTWPTAC